MNALIWFLLGTLFGAHALRRSLPAAPAVPTEPAGEPAVAPLDATSTAVELVAEPPHGGATHPAVAEQELRQRLDGVSSAMASLSGGAVAVVALALKPNGLFVCVAGTGNVNEVPAPLRSTCAALSAKAQKVAFCPDSRELRVQFRAHGQLPTCSAN